MENITSGGDVRLSNLYVLCFDTEFKTKWMFADNVRSDRNANKYNMAELKAVFFPKDENVKFNYMCFRESKALKEIELNPENGSIVSKKNLIDSKGYVTIATGIRMDKHTLVLVDPVCLLVLHEK